jgi:hypothetical protein
MNHLALQRKNLELAQKFQSALLESGTEESAAFSKNMEEMVAFYQLMIERYLAFYRDWMTQKEGTLTVPAALQQDAAGARG